MFLQLFVSQSIVCHVLATMYSMESVNQIRREIISISKDSEIGCALKCEKELKCKQAGIVPDGNSNCYLFGEETNVTLYLNMFLLIGK